MWKLSNEYMDPESRQKAVPCGSAGPPKLLSDHSGTPETVNIQYALGIWRIYCGPVDSCEPIA